MDILIKNMEMPNTCRRCIEIGIPVHCRVMEQEAVTAVMSGYDRQSDCPLVALPEHGRLIDAYRLAEEFDGQGVYMEEEVKKIIDFFPAVVEASNGTDN